MAESTATRCAFCHRREGRAAVAAGSPPASDVDPLSPGEERALAEDAGIGIGSKVSLERPVNRFLSDEAVGEVRGLLEVPAKLSLERPANRFLSDEAVGEVRGLLEVPARRPRLEGAERRPLGDVASPERLPEDAPARRFLFEAPARRLRLGGRRISI